MDFKTNKGLRVLDIYERLKKGFVLNKEDIAEEFGVTPKSIQRDIDDLRAYLSDNSEEFAQIKYSRKENGYCLVYDYGNRLTNPEILALSKILLESRAFNTGEMRSMLDKLIDSCVPERDKKTVMSLVANERHNYVPLKHGKPLTERIWEISGAVKEQKLMRVTYKKLKSEQTVTRTLQPVGIMFSEFYFYLLAFIVDDKTYEPVDSIDDLYPTIYRIDRITGYEITKIGFRVAYADRFQEGEFRKRVQFMYGGKLRKIKFKYSGLSIESVLDRLPTAKAVKQSDGTYIVTAEVFGNGVDMWMRGQGENVEPI